MSLTPTQLEELQTISVTLRNNFPFNANDQWWAAIRIQNADLGPNGSGGQSAFDAAVADMKATQLTIQQRQGILGSQGTGFREATLQVIPVGGGAVPVEDEGSVVVAAPTALNFIGPGVAAVDNGGVADITVPATSLFFGTVLSLESQNTGARVLPGGGATNNVKLEIHSTVGERGSIGYDFSADLAVLNSVLDNEVVLRTLDAFSGLRTHLRVGGVGSATGVAFHNTNPIVKPTVTGSANGAVASLLTALANYGLVTDSSTAAPEIEVFKSADTSRANTTSVTDDPDLVITGLTVGRWELDMFILCSNAASSSVAFESLFRIGSGMTVTPSMLSFLGVSDANVSRIGGALSLTTQKQITTTVGQSRYLRFKAVFSITVVGDGIIAWQWGPSVSQAVPTVIEENSILTMRRFGDL